jgi:hypothetical protein
MQPSVTQVREQLRNPASHFERLSHSVGARLAVVSQHLRSYYRRSKLRCSVYVELHSRVCSFAVLQHLVVTEQRQRDQLSTANTSIQLKCAALSTKCWQLYTVRVMSTVL